MKSAVDIQCPVCGYYCIGNGGAGCIDKFSLVMEEEKRAMSIENSNSNYGIGFSGLLTILFIGLKLTGYIPWSWWWVLSPILIPIGLVLAVLFVFLVVYGIAAIVGD